MEYILVMVIESMPSVQTGQTLLELFSSTVILGLLYKLLAASIVVLATYLIGRYLGVFLNRFLVRLDEDLRRRVIDIGRYLVYSIGILIAIAIASPEPFTFSVLLLLVGLAVVISLSDLLRNWGSELYIRTVKPFKVGDWVDIAGRGGRVVRMDSLGVVLETIDRERVYVPNSLVAREIVLNRSTPYGTLFRIYIELPTDVEEISASEYIARVLDEVRPELVDEPRVSYRGVVGDRSVFEVSIVLLNIRKIDSIVGLITRRIRERWSTSRVRM